jgi:hypothetical protein
MAAEWQSKASTLLLLSGRSGFPAGRPSHRRCNPAGFGGCSGGWILQDFAANQSVNKSPIEQLLEALDGLDLERTMALSAPDVRLLVIDGRDAEGAAAVRELITTFFAALRASTHRITAEWHQENVWIAEVEANYELKDRTRLGSLPRVFVLRDGPDGFTDLRVYGAHERALPEHGSGEREMVLGGHRMPPL